MGEYGPEKRMFEDSFQSVPEIAGVIKYAKLPGNMKKILSKVKTTSCVLSENFPKCFRMPIHRTSFSALAHNHLIWF